MGAGVVFRDDVMQAVAKQVPGPACSLLAEAAAMLELLLRAPLNVKLTIFCYSLSLLRLLKNYHRLDFLFQPFQHRQADLIERILDRLRLCTATTVMVKVKSHTGIKLNKGADHDCQAKLGLDAELMTACPHNDALLFRVGGALLVQAELHRAKIQWYAQRRQWREDHTVSGVTTLSFQRPGLGQQYMGAAMRRLPSGHRLRWWLSLCYCYPTQAYRYRTNQTDDLGCRMPECGQRETYYHITCAC
eukprot:2271072-Rhodomonas_salina.4